MDLESLAERLGKRLTESRYLLVTAESCTGGWVAQVVTSVPGSSHWFDRGFVTYTNTAKQEMLGVQARTLEHAGAVSEATVREMAEGALTHSHGHVSVAVSGVAGPGGGTPDKPVGTVWFAWAAVGHPTRAQAAHFDGDRQAVRRKSVELALAGVLEMLGERG